MEDFNSPLFQIEIQQDSSFIKFSLKVSVSVR